MYRGKTSSLTALTNVIIKWCHNVLRLTVRITNDDLKRFVAVRSGYRDNACCTVLCIIYQYRSGFYSLILSLILPILLSLILLPNDSSYFVDDGRSTLQPKPLVLWYCSNVLQALYFLFPEVDHHSNQKKKTTTFPSSTWV